MTLIDMWTGPTPVTNQFPRNEPNGIRMLLDKIKALELQIKESTSNLLRTAGIRLTPAGMTINSDLTLTGTLTANGIINDGALANPTIRQAVNLTSTAFAPTSTWAEVAGLDLTVPADCTRLLVTASTWVYAVNNSAAADDLHTRVSLGATDGQAFLTPLPIAGFNTISAGLAVLAEGLVPAATLRLKASAKTTTGAWTTDAANTATLVASLTWLR